MKDQKVKLKFSLGAQNLHVLKKEAGTKNAVNLLMG